MDGWMMDQQQFHHQHVLINSSKMVRPHELDHITFSDQLAGGLLSEDFGEQPSART